MYDLDSITMSPSFLDEGEGKPEIVRRMRRIYSVLGELEWKRMAAAYYATISYLDSEVGRLLDRVEDLGLSDSTIVIFTSDHGDMLGAHGLITKGIGTGYDEVYGIPLIMKGPGVKPQGELGHLVSMVDLAPTILDLCGAAPIAECQGTSLTGVLKGEQGADEMQDAYAEFFGQRFVYTQRLVWHERWKYIFNPGGIDELYDLHDDPHELNNLAQDPEHREVLHDMARRMWAKMKEIGDDSLFNTHYATLRTAPVGPGG
jgi:arylsulfatase A-like enzyme